MPAQWFYRDEGGQERGPVEADKLKSLAAAGTIGGSTEVRREDLDQWVAAETVRGLIPEAGAAAASAAPAAATSEAANPYEAPNEQVQPIRRRSRPRSGEVDLSIIAPLSRVTGWLKFLGIVNIIGGAFTALSIVGIIIAWLPIWMGILALQAAGRIREGVERDNEPLARQGVQKLSTVILIFGIVTLIYLILVALYIGFIITMVATGGVGALSRF